jgi:hypothetical protein
MKLKLSLVSLFSLWLIAASVEAQSSFSKINIYDIETKSENYLDFSFDEEIEFKQGSISTTFDLKPSSIENRLTDIKTNSFPEFSNRNIMLTQNNQQNSSLSRRLKYSSLWAFTSLNYLYADVVGLMDMNLLNQYQTGVVNGIEVTPAFLTTAAAYMQIPLSNVFLPHVIKNENALRWVQIISGTIATLAQGATLFVGEPEPYYVLFSAIEMGITSYITIDAIRWKVGKKKTTKLKGF